jgi:molecular chaperone IbpA
MNNLQAGVAPRHSLHFDLPPVPSASPIIDLPGDGFPPYNIERLDSDLYRIIIGVAGYTKNEIEVRQQDADLIVRGETRALASNGETIRRLIEPRFERRFRLLGGFRLDEWVMRNGLLLIDVWRDPALPMAAEWPPKRSQHTSIASVVPARPRRSPARKRLSNLATAERRKSRRCDTLDGFRRAGAAVRPLLLSVRQSHVIYNKRVRQTAVIQEHRMVRKALEMRRVRSNLARPNSLLSVAP